MSIIDDIDRELAELRKGKKPLTITIAREDGEVLEHVKLWPDKRNIVLADDIGIAVKVIHSLSDKFDIEG